MIMKKSRLIRAGIAAAIVLTLPALATADGDKCKNVRFRITNEHATHKTILITAVSYHDVVNNKDVTKGLKNLECDYQKTCLTDDKDLSDVEGTDIKNIRFEFKSKEGDGDWSDKKMSGSFNATNSAECKADRTYGPPPKGFVIGGD
jgi:hypothetical protein